MCSIARVRLTNFKTLLELRGEAFMKIGKVIKTAIRWAPVVYPFVKKYLDSRKSAATATPRRR